jgi:hypothetical protein
MEQQSLIEKKVEKYYEKNPVIRALVPLIFTPFATGIDAALMQKLQNIKEERARAFFDELADGKIELTGYLIKTEDFLHCFYATTKAALNTRRRQKIRMFARLLKSATIEGAFSDTDEYEEYLGILDELSYQEICMLLFLEKYENKFPKLQNENDLQRANRFWLNYIEDLKKKLNIPELEIDARLTRLNRTGCYETFVGGYMNYTGGKGKLTPTYFRIKKFIISKNETFGNNR